VASVERILHDKRTYARMAHVRNPFGDGRAAERIVKILDAWFRSPAFDAAALRRKVEYVPGGKRGSSARR
jgi:UDP-N-acetylglucosamine 2-epimerase